MIGQQGSEQRDDERSGAGGGFSDEVVAAVVAHMNADHVEDCLTIVRTAGARPDARSARMVGLDELEARFVVDAPGGSATVAVAWSRPLTERAQIREELARMVHEAEPT